MDYDLKSRFEILCIETAEEYLLKKEIASEEAKKEAEENKRKAETEGVCQGCGKKNNHLKWIDENLEIVSYGLMYLCYECWEYDRKCYFDCGIPSEHLCHISDYMSENNWNDEG